MARGSGIPEIKTILGGTAVIDTSLVTLVMPNDARIYHGTSAPSGMLVAPHIWAVSAASADSCAMSVLRLGGT
eukprot:4959764-Amphidinium_carterae.1